MCEAVARTLQLDRVAADLTCRRMMAAGAALAQAIEQDVELEVTRQLIHLHALHKLRGEGDQPLERLQVAAIEVKPARPGRWRPASGSQDVGERPRVHRPRAFASWRRVLDARGSGRLAATAAAMGTYASIVSCRLRSK